MRYCPPGFIEVFNWIQFGLSLNVSKALKIVGAPYAEPDGWIQVESVRNAYWIRNITACDRADLSEPVLVATIGDIRLLVDGRHRVQRALVLGKSKLPCYILTEKETAQCFEGKQQQQRYRKLRDFLRQVEIKVDVVNGATARREEAANGHHPPTLRRTR